jgi:hypothetical protein
MGRKELSEAYLGGGQSIRDEIRRSNERIDGLLQAMAEASRQRAICTEEFIAKSDVVRAESLAFRRELRERINRIDCRRSKRPERG